jgi:hypothetical protein
MGVDAAATYCGVVETVAGVVATELDAGVVLTGAGVRAAAAAGDLMATELRAEGGGEIPTMSGLWQRQAERVCTIGLC